MSDQENNETKMDEQVQRAQQTSRYNRKYTGSDRKNQDLGEDDGHQSNNSVENDDNTRGRIHRGGFRRGRGRGRFNRGFHFNNNRRGYRPYADFMSAPAGYYGPQYGLYPGPFPDFANYDDQEGNFGQEYQTARRGRRRNRRNRRNTKTEIADNENQEQQQQQQQQQNENNANRKPRRQRRKTNDNQSGNEQPTDGAVTDDQQQVQDDNKQGSTVQRKSKNNRRRRRNTNASTENDERIKSVETKPIKSDEVIVKNLLRSLVFKVARRLATKNRPRSRHHTKEANENNNINHDIEQPNTNARRGRRHRTHRQGNNYFIEQGYYDPYGISTYYYGVYGGFGGQGFPSRGRGRGGRGRARFRRGTGANKENQPQTNSEDKKVDDNTPSNTTGDNIQGKLAITEQVNQSS